MMTRQRRIVMAVLLLNLPNSSNVSKAFLTVTVPSKVRTRSKSKRHTSSGIVCNAWSAGDWLLQDQGTLYPSNKEKQAKVDDESILVSKSRSTKLISNAPSVSSLILVKGWSPAALQKFKDAVDTVVEENPVLSGKIDGKIEGWGATELHVRPGIFQPQSHSFVQQIDLLNAPSPKDLDEAGHLEYMDKYVAPLMSKDTTMDRIRNGSPLFNIKVVTLPDEYACIHMDMSHAVGDLVTYLHIAKQISDVTCHKPIHPIDWTNPLIASHDLFPGEFNQSDIENAYGLPFLIGVVMHMPFMWMRKKQYMLLSREKVKSKANELSKETGRSVNSNDVVTAALCDANRSSDIFALTRSMRGITPGLKRNMGGNLHSEIPFQRCAGRNPHAIRDILAKGRYFEPGEMPFLESLAGRVGRITNCLVADTNLSLGGAKTVCFAAPKAFLDFCPLDTAIIFRMNKKTFGVMHNFQMLQQSELLDDLRVTGQLMPMEHF